MLAHVHFAALLFPLAGSAFAQFPGPEGQGADLVAYRFEHGERAGIGVALRGASGPAFLWEARLDGGAWVELGMYALDEGGAGRAQLALSGALARLASRAEYRARFLSRSGLAATAGVTSTSGSVEEPLGQEWDFDWALGGKKTKAGEVVSTTQPWVDFCSISATNANPAHPDVATLVRSKAWLEGPGSTVGGLAARSPSGLDEEDLGRLLVIAADATDADGDGRIDTPSSETAGGVLTFDFTGPARVTIVRLFDIDEPGGKLRAYDGLTLLGEDDIPELGDRSVQELFVPGGYGAVTRVEVELTGSGGVVDLVTIPCPSIINFDETSTGVPIDLVAGQQPGGYNGLGLFEGFITATNNDPTHPDVALLYDTGDPSAQDPDLATPGTGTGNTVAQRKVVVIAEDVVDGDGDGIVDAPDAEKAGGVISFGWVTSDVFFESITVIDVDDGEVSFVRVFDDSIQDWVVLRFADLGNNSVQTVASSIGPTRQIEVHFGGSAAVAELRICSDGD